MNNIKDYFKDINYRLKQDPQATGKGLVILIICLLLFFLPIHFLHKYGGETAELNAYTQRNYAQAKKIKSKAHKRVRYAKVQLKNQPEIQADVEKHVQKFANVQRKMIYWQNNHAPSTSDRATANAITKQMLSSNASISPDNGLYMIAPFDYGHAKGLTLDVGYSPEYSVYQNDIHVTFLIRYLKKYPIYIVDGYYNLKHNKFDQFDTYRSFYTTEYMRNPNWLTYSPKKRKQAQENKIKNGKKMPAKMRREIEQGKKEREARNKKKGGAKK